MKTHPDLYICKLCGGPLHEDDDFCGDCGTPCTPVETTQNLCFCSACGNALSDDDDFCGGCGTPCTPVETTQDLCFCSACGSSLNGGDAYCSRCGAPQQRKETDAPPHGIDGPTEGARVPPVGGDSSEFNGIFTPPSGGETGGSSKNKLLVYMLTGVAALLLIVVLIFVLQPKAILGNSTDNTSPSETAPTPEPTPTAAPVQTGDTEWMSIYAAFIDAGKHEPKQSWKRGTSYTSPWFDDMDDLCTDTTPKNSNEFIRNFFLHDLNDDGIPELFVARHYTCEDGPSYDVYTQWEGTVIFVDGIYEGFDDETKASADSDHPGVFEYQQTGSDGGGENIYTYWTMRDGKLVGTLVYSEGYGYDESTPSKKTGDTNLYNAWKNSTTITRYQGRAAVLAFLSSGSSDTTPATANLSLEQLVLEGENRYYTRDELSGKTAYELSILRNGMYAMVGKIFQKNMEVKSFFEACDWYRPLTTGDVRNKFNGFQSANVDLIATIEAERKKQGTAPAPAPTAESKVAATTAPGAQTNTGVGWKDAYINWVQAANNTYFGTEFALVYVDNDSIPELFVPTEALLYYDGKKLVEKNLGLEGGDCFCYVERGGVFGDEITYINGDTDFVYKIQNNTIILLHEGSRTEGRWVNGVFEEADYSEWDGLEDWEEWEKDLVLQYLWDGKEVSEAEYKAKLASSLKNAKSAKSPGFKLYSAAQIIEQIRNFK